MCRKLLLFLPGFAVLFLFTYTLLSATLLLRWSNYSYPPQSPPTHGQCTSRQPLRVYMYDLPRKFHVGMFDLNNNAEDSVPLTAKNFPPWPNESSFITVQHSMEYWLMASLFYEDGGEDREAVRVLDPETADVFFVPIFSALSFYIIKLGSIELALQVELLEILHRSKYWQRFKGRDHVVPLTFPGALDFLHLELNESIFFVVDFDGYPKRVSNLRKDVVSPYVHLVEPFRDDDPPDPFESRTTLLFFRGYIKRRDGGLRLKLQEILAGHEEVHYQYGSATSSGASMSAKFMQSSKFCLSPAGDTASSCRLFDAIVSHCVPVIVSDYIELPYENELNYSEFSIFFSTKEALQPNFMVDRLRRFPKMKWIGMWRRLKNISHHFEFQYPPKKDDAVNMLWRQVKQKLHAARLAKRRSHQV